MTNKILVKIRGWRSKNCICNIDLNIYCCCMIAGSTTTPLQAGWAGQTSGGIKLAGGGILIALPCDGP